MIKYFCDNCEDEITEKNEFSGKDFIFDFNGFIFNIKIADTIPIDGVICKYCVIDAVNDIDDRPIDECSPTIIKQG